MTDAEALAEARARWRARGVVHVEVTRLADGAVLVAFCVGALDHDPHAWNVHGRGHSWRAAFDDADQRRPTVRRGGQ